MPTPTNISNPIRGSQEWINQIGYEGKFAPNTGNNLLLHGLLGGGAGLTTGALAHKNMWATSASTGVGAILGQLLAEHFSNPENQQTNGTLGALAGGGIGLGSALLARKKKQKSLELPGGLQITAKTAAFQDILDKVKNQLPVMRVPDLAVGGTIGGGVGWLYDKLKAKKNESEAEQHKNKWRRILGGAGVGAAGANIVGDRARRYISNTLLPYSYNNNKDYIDGFGNFRGGPTSLMKPTLKKVWNAGILDRPQQNGVADYLAGKQQADTSDISDNVTNMAARRELLRLGMGIGAGKDSIWKRQPDSTYSLNPANKHIDDFLTDSMFPDNNVSASFYNNPVEAVADVNQDPRTGMGLMTSISGGQRVPLFPYKGKWGNDYLARLLKKFNVDVRPNERNSAIKYLKDKYIHRIANPKMDTINSYQTGQSPSDQLSVLAKRYVLEHAVMKNSPWVSQRMYFKQLPPDSSKIGDLTKRFAAIPSTADGELYPGKSIGIYDPINDQSDFIDAAGLTNLDKSTSN